jgi:hypothetical protein
MARILLLTLADATGIANPSINRRKRDEILTNAISNDNFLTRQAAQEPKPDTDGAQKRGRDTPAQKDLTDVGRGHQRLSLETEGANNPAIHSFGEARRQIASFRAQLVADPQAALNAHERVDAKKFEAAMAGPTA